MALGMALKFYNSVAKELKLKFRKFFGDNSSIFWEFWGKTSGGSFWPSPHADRFNKQNAFERLILFKCNFA